MSTKFTLKVNGNEVNVTSPETRRLLSVITTIKDPLADSIQYALNQKAADSEGQIRPLREFYGAMFTEGKNADDVFQVTLTNGDEFIQGEATRQVISNRLHVATNISDFQVAITKSAPVTAEGKAPKAAATKAVADNI